VLATERPQLLVPCYDLSTAVSFVFSRVDAIVSDNFDFGLDLV
jgi:hypothetical protein